MKVGDLVKMKYIAFWQKKNNPPVSYHEHTLVILETHLNAVKVLYPCGMIKSDLAEYYEVVSEVS